jgi:ubiquinone/menaquinone biosynthesis C-methylase UbiE
MIKDTSLVYDETPIWSAPFGLTLLDTVQMLPEINILDIGSGGGFPLIELAERFGESCQVHGIDPSEETNMMIREKIRLKEIRNVSIIQGVAENMPFKDNFFGLIASNNGLNNVQDIKKTLKECFRVCRFPGQMVVTMNLPDTFSMFYRVFGEVLKESGMIDKVAEVGAHIREKRKSVDEWITLIEEAGFIIRSATQRSFSFRYLNAGAFFNHFLIRKYFMEHWISLIPEDKTDEIMKETELKLNSLAEHEGELNMEVPYVCFDCIKR